jgi:hypothetical protein
MRDKPNLADETITACLRAGCGSPGARLTFLPLGNDAQA